jgi:hypothetical protein
MENCSSSFEINTSGHDSRLLSLESPILPSGSSSSSRTGPGGQDLSLSELSISDHTATMPKPFSLLAKVDLDPATPTRNNEAVNPEIHSDEHENDDSDFLNDEADEDLQKQAEKRKEEKLQSDIFILKKLNASFELFNDALQETGSANQVKHCLLHLLKFTYIPSIISSELQHSSNKPMLSSINTSASCQHLKNLLAFFLTNNGRELKLSVVINYICSRCLTMP